jgi:hypothetical protein
MAHKDKQRNATKNKIFQQKLSNLPQKEYIPPPTNVIEHFQGNNAYHIYYHCVPTYFYPQSKTSLFFWQISFSTSQEHFFKVHLIIFS